MSDRLRAIHEKQVHREPWPRFEAFDEARHPLALRRRGAEVWIARAREEHKSVFEFSSLLREACRVELPVPVLGALARLVTDETRHVELCVRMAEACLPDDPPKLGRGRTPWPEPPPPGSDPQLALRWMADGVVGSCCIGEELSRPLYEACATAATDPVCEEVLRQILRDENLHAAFGWEAIGLLWERLSTESREWMHGRLSRALAGYELTCTSGIPIDELAGTEVVIERDTEPNLGTISPRQYAGIFYATLESEVFPKLAAVGLDPVRAWRERPAYRRAVTS